MADGDEDGGRNVDEEQIHNDSTPSWRVTGSIGSLIRFPDTWDDSFLVVE